MNIIHIYPVKHVTWILMEIPYHFMYRIDGSLVQIHTHIHDYSMTFIQVLFIFHLLKHDMDFLDKFKSWNFLGIC